MNYFLVLLAAFCLIGCSSRLSVGSPKNDLDYKGLRGNVKSVKSELYNLIPEKDTFRLGEKINSLSLDRNAVMEFNDKGNLSSIKEYYSNGRISAETDYTYDKKNRLIHRKEIDYYGKGSFYDYSFSYNAKDSIIRVDVTNQDFKVVHQIDRDNRNRVVKERVIQDDSVIAINTRYYNNEGNLIEEKKYRNENSLVKITTRTFDVRNLKQTEQITEFTKWDTLSYQIKFIYDANLNLVEEKEYHNDTLFMITSNKYFENGQLQETQNIPIGDDYAVVKIQRRNEMGELIEHSLNTRGDNDSDIWNYKYKYDPFGNWIEKVEFKNEDPLRIVKRSIEYYQ